MNKPSILPQFAVTTIDNAYSEVADTRLAATIYAFDVPLHKEQPYTTSAGDGVKGVRVVWHFHQPDPAGNSPKEIVRLWTDSPWQERNPHDPLTVCKQAFENYEHLRRMLQLGRGLSHHAGPCAAVTNTRKASVMCALGHPLIGWRRNDRVTTWCFHQAAAADATLYDDPALYAKLPDAAISYAKGAILGHEKMVDCIKQIQFARVEHRGRVALVGKDMTPDKINALEKILYRR